jgi:hypothetical protein
VAIERVASEEALRDVRAHLELAKIAGIELPKSQLTELIFANFDLQPERAGDGVVASTETVTVEQETDYSGNLKRTETTRRDVYVKEAETPAPPPPSFSADTGKGAQA